MITMESKAGMKQPGQSGFPDPSLGWRLGVSFAVVALLYLDPVPQSMALNILDLATSLVDHGSVLLDEYRGIDVALREGFVLSGMPPGASFAAAVVYLVFHPIFELVPSGSVLPLLNVLCTILLGIPAATLTVCVVYHIALRWGSSPRDALLTAGLLAFGTMHFGYATGFYKNTLAAACLLSAFWFLTPPKGGCISESLAGLAGLLSGLAIGQDYASALIALGLGGYLVLVRARLTVVAVYAIGTAAALLPVLVYHQVAFGAPWLTSYHYIPQITEKGLTVPRPYAFLYLLVTLLAASPCLVWSIVGWKRAMQIRELRPAMITIAGLMFATLLLHSGWAGGRPYAHETNFASRYLLSVVPFCVLPMSFGLPPSLKSWPMVIIGWSIAATFLAAQASMIPWGTVPLLYSLKVLFTSWGTGPFFSETIASWLGIPTLHQAIAHGVISRSVLFEPGNRELLFSLLLGQALIKMMSLVVTAVAALLLWRFVWRPVVIGRSQVPCALR